MTTLTELRLRNQLLLQPPFDAPQQVVEWMGAVQAQDYRMAKWAVGCRTASTDATQIEAALNRGDILRTHLLRPTWHFVSSKDLRWMLSLTADRIRAANDSYARGTDAALDSKSIHRYMNLLQKTLEGNKHRTKEEIGEALNQRGIPLSQYALRHLLPAYDQYLIGYKDRSDVLAKEHTSKAFNSHGIFQPVILCDGQIVGNWKRTAGRGNVTIQTTLWVDTVPEALDAAIARYRSFIGGTKSENSPEAL